MKVVCIEQRECGYLTGAPNVIPGKVVMSLEIRDLSEEKIFEMYRRIVAESAPTDERLRTVIANSAEQLGLSYKAMPSGAGHDAQDMAQIAPAGMIFVPSVGGISHSPEEYTRPRDMANGADVLLQTFLAIDAGALEL